VNARTGIRLQFAAEGSIESGIHSELVLT
jgi:hypothetical protein